jgi:hypothetical protein
VNSPLPVAGVLARNVRMRASVASANGRHRRYRFRLRARRTLGGAIDSERTFADPLLVDESEGTV